MATSKKGELRIVVTRSFANLNEGDEFNAEPGDEWVRRHIDAGLLREVPGGRQGADQARQG